MDDELERLRRASAKDARVIPLGGGLPARDAFPREALARAFEQELAADDTAALQYGWPEGRRGLRELIAAQLRARGADVEAHDVIVTSGAQQAIALAAQHACASGAPIVCSAESYPAALDLFRRLGLTPTVDRGSGRAAYAMPAIDNPRGSTMAMRARDALLEMGGPILEDDAYADLWFDEAPPSPLLSVARERVYAIGSFAKTLCPGLRVGYLVPPRDAIEAVRKLKASSDLQTNGLAQALVERFLAQHDFDAHVRRLRFAYARRAERLCSALRRYLPSFHFDRPAGGFSVWVETGIEVDERVLLERAIAHGTAFDPGSDFHVTGRSQPLTLRLSYSAAEEDDLEEGVRRLAFAWSTMSPAHHAPDA